jgi:prolipoprotein diacylglyceryl transferase
MLAYLYWDPSPALFPWNIPLLGRPVLWYGFFFALGFFFGYWVLLSLVRRSLSRPQAILFTERITLYVIAGAIIGSRLGDVLFYQNWAEIAKDPLSVLRFWEGGLASHGGAIGIFLSLLLFSFLHRQFPFLKVLDLVVIPTALGGGCIRLGNFFNQEILGKVTTVPWAVIFGHPADGGPIVPRHPVQLYEALWYFLSFALLYLYGRRKESFIYQGRVAGLFFILVFGFRFFVEFWKEEQSSHIGADSLLHMGQYLSIPFILAGLYLFLRKQKNV